MTRYPAAHLKLENKTHRRQVIDQIIVNLGDGNSIGYAVALAGYRWDFAPVKEALLGDNYFYKFYKGYLRAKVVKREHNLRAIEKYRNTHKEK